MTKSRLGVAVDQRGRSDSRELAHPSLLLTHERLIREEPR
jgi:hypothetical protein